MANEPTRRRWPGNDPHPASHAEKLLSALGAFLGIFGVVVIGHALLDAQGTAMVAASMGASAVLLFAVPHSALARPWAVFGGHLVSAAVGITCARLIDDPLIAAALAVSLATAAMYYARCLHPPGGASALAAVIGGPAIQSLGYAYLVTPLLLNLVVLLGIALLFNAPFAHRRYPVRQSAPPTGEKAMIAHSDLVYALSEIDSFIDVSEDDLVRIYNLAMQHAGTERKHTT